MSPIIMICLSYLALSIVIVAQWFGQANRRTILVLCKVANLLAHLAVAACYFLMYRAALAG